ncbi:MAG: radical SAM protein [Candidatus Delongbacteria bacterium]|nr:radical SAM protein [Candidatus Delongbacteria bacterium]
MTTQSFKSIYGPVPSRRLGRSLGIDLVPYKTCTYDCVYCQLGRTTNLTMERKDYQPIPEILDELKSKLGSGIKCDYIGLAGSGEPTLHSGIGDLIDGIKRITDIPVAVLTNGSLLWIPEVRQSLAEADLVLPSLDIGNPEDFKQINRPHPAIEFTAMVDGLIRFSREYSGTIRLEILLVGKITDRDPSIEAIAQIVNRIQPDRVQLNTVYRPPAESNLLPVPAKRLAACARQFPGHVDIIAPNPNAIQSESSIPETIGEEILALLERRPCTIDDIAQGLGQAPNLIIKTTESLCRSNQIRTVRIHDRTYYQIEKETKYNQ